MSAQELVQRIRALHIPHLHYERARNQVNAQTLLMPEGHVIVLAGPTRAGKTTLVQEVHKGLQPKNQADQRQPSLYVQVETTDRGAISTRYLFSKILQALGHPFHSDISNAALRATETAIRLRIPHAMAHRETKVLILDEAHHLLRERSRASAGAALDSLKCLANETGVRILLSGGYQLLTTCFASAHLNGRLNVVELPRYSSSPSDADEFDRILATYDLMLPWSSGCSLFKMRQHIYNGTLGCCGLISSWVQLAIACMHAEGQRKLNASHFRTGRLEQQIEEIRRDIELGESLLTELPYFHNAPVASQETRPRRYPPGKRNPKRDQVRHHDEK